MLAPIQQIRTSTRTAQLEEEREEILTALAGLSFEKMQTDTAHASGATIYPSVISTIVNDKPHFNWIQGYGSLTSTTPQLSDELAWIVPGNLFPRKDLYFVLPESGILRCSSMETYQNFAHEISEKPNYSWITAKGLSRDDVMFSDYKDILSSNQ
jgi:hypothetical protein